jgi:drug/metabolite transporter (DMT)-like permease
MTDSKARLAGALMVMAAAIAFSGKAVIIKLAYRHQVDPLTLLALRMLMSAPLFLALAWWASRSATAQPLDARDRVNILLLGLVGYYLASYFDFLGLQYVTAALGRLLLYIHPTFVVLLAAALFGRPITGRDVLAIGLSYIGIALAFGHDLATQPGNVALGAFWVLLSALFYAFYLLGSGRLVGRVGSLRFASHAGLASCVGVIAHYLVTHEIATVLAQPAEVYWLSLLMAVVSTVLPIVLMSEGIRRIGPSHASIIGSVGPIATIFLGLIFLDEQITAVQLLGAGLVMAGVLAISLQRARPGAA